MNEKVPIKIAAKMFGVSMQTLRRWDSSGFFKSSRFGGTKCRHYSKDEIENLLVDNYKYLEKACRKWAFSDAPTTRLFPIFHCQDTFVFKARLSKLVSFLAQDEYLKVGSKYSLITSIVGEIGNNSFDHNIGNWIDERGIFFGYNLTERKIILADRGQGLLTTLKTAKPKLSTHHDALKVAFTEYVTGRVPENRGNGLKFVKDIVEDKKEEAKDLNLNLYFQSGDAEVVIKKGDDDLDIKNAKNPNRGCFVILSY